MDVGTPLDLSRNARHLDESGTPAALIELARRRGDIAVIERVEPGFVLIEFPMGGIWRAQTRCARFVRLRTPIDGKHYALVRSTVS